MCTRLRQKSDCKIERENRENRQKEAAPPEREHASRATEAADDSAGEIYSLLEAQSSSQRSVGQMREREGSPNRRIMMPVVVVVAVAVAVAVVVVRNELLQNGRCV